MREVLKDDDEGAAKTRTANGQRAGLVCVDLMRIFI